MSNYSLDDHLALFKAIDTIPDDSKCRVAINSLVNDKLYGYLLYSLERGVVHRDHIQDILSSIFDETHDDYERLEIGSLVTACVAREDAHVLSIARRQAKDYDVDEILTYLLKHDIADLVDICVIRYTAYLTNVILVCALIISREMFDELLKELTTRMTCEELFCLVSIKTGIYYTKWETQIEMAVIRAYDKSLKEYDTSKMEVSDIKRLQFLIETVDQV